MIWNNYLQKWLRYVLCSVVRLYQLSLAALIGTKPPSGCEGEPLVELFR